MGWADRPEMTRRLRFCFTQFVASRGSHNTEWLQTTAFYNLIRCFSLSGSSFCFHNFTLLTVGQTKVKLKVTVVFLNYGNDVVFGHASICKRSCCICENFVEIPSFSLQVLRNAKWEKNKSQQTKWVFQNFN